MLDISHVTSVVWLDAQYGVLLASSCPILTTSANYESYAIYPPIVFPAILCVNL